MIFVTHSLPVNESGQAAVDRAALWDGLVAKANNALPFVAAMTHCEVLSRLGEDVFDRAIEVRGQALTERVTLERPHRVVFTRLTGPVLGTITNEIEGPDDALSLRFSFALAVLGVPGGSAEEQRYAEGMRTDYLKAVESTLAAVRRVTLARSS
ncbi:MAG TPA: SRPBCC family protein [Pseudonocardia sp.]|nr:SRPBCC family protein [Pseudonocardia sp.]